MAMPEVIAKCVGGTVVIAVEGAGAVIFHGPGPGELVLPEALEKSHGREQQREADGRSRIWRNRTPRRPRLGGDFT